MTAPGSVADKVIVVTGGASGIGRAAALACGARGAQVVIGDLDAAGGAAAASDIVAGGGQATFVPADVSREADCERLMATTLELHGRLDVLIACAGILQGAFVDVTELDVDTFDRVLDVNVRGTFLSVKYAVRAMASAGVVLLVASGAGVTGGSSSFAYGASKGGVHGLGLVLQQRLADRAIRVNTVAPGSIATPLKQQNVRDAGAARGAGAADTQAALDKLGDPDGVARVLAFLASDEAAYVRGTVFTR